MPADRRSFISPLLTERGFCDARALLDLPGEIVSGHPDRHVVRVVLGAGRERLVAYLKREHRVSIRDRVANAFSGFGLVSKSVREARTLEQLRAAGIPVPRVLAYGECYGRAFLLVRALCGYRDLRELLRAGEIPDWQRRFLARRLGRLLARVHAAGFDMPDLLCKHVMVHRRMLRLSLLDWSRTSRQGKLPTETRIRDLALLHSSLADGMATPRDRLACLRAYCGTASVRTWADAIRGVASALPHRRAVRESCQQFGRVSGQRLRWVRGDESLCVTSGFWRRGRGQIPDWLRSAANGSERAITVARRWLGENVLLRRSPPRAIWRNLVSKLFGRRMTAAAVRDAGLIFRLQRFGIPTPRLLAFGGRPDGGGFLLTRPIADTAPLRAWLASPQKRWTRVLRRIGRLIRRIHDAGCYLGAGAEVLHVRGDGRGVVIADVRGVRIHTLRTEAARVRDLRRLLASLGLPSDSIDSERVTRGYLGERARVATKRMTRTVVS